MAQQVEAIANTLLELGRIKGQGAANQGQIWGNTLAGLGQIPQQIQQAKAQQQDMQLRSQEMQIRQMQVGAQQRQQAAEDALNNAYSNALNPDGSIDMDRLTQHIAGTPAASQLPKIQAGLASVQEKQLQVSKLRGEVASAERDHMAAVANAADAGTDPETKAATLLVGVASGIKSGAISPEAGHPIIAQILSQAGTPDPEAVTRTIARMKALSASDVEKRAVATKDLAEAAKAGSGSPPLMNVAGGNTVFDPVTRQPVFTAPAKPGTDLKPGTVESFTQQARDIATQKKGAPLTLPEQQAVDTIALRQFKTLAQDPSSQQLNEAVKRMTLALGAQRLASGGADKLVKVEHKDPTTGRTVIEWLPQSELRGQTFEKGTPGTVENRLASAQAVAQTGDDIIKQLKDPETRKMLGPLLGRSAKLQDFIGNPPPQFSELAGSIESYALANMGVHGMRSAQGAEMIKKLLDAHHTPDSLIGAIQGLQKFSTHFMQNEGRSTGAPSDTNAPPPGAKVRSYNPTTGKFE